MSTENTQENLNDVKNLEKTTSGLDYKYKSTNDAGTLYKKIIKSLNSYSKGEILLKDDIISLVRNEYETL
jgi:hypothetical protein